MNKSKEVEKNKEETEDNVFKTADFVLSVFLLYSGIELLRVEPYPNDSNENRKYFVFKKIENIDSLLNHYISSDPTVRLKKFISVQKKLKKLIYQK